MISNFSQSLTVRKYSQAALNAESVFHNKQAVKLMYPVLSSYDVQIQC